MAKKQTKYVVYQGRLVPVDHFRVYVFNKDNRKLVESYPEYLEAINSGLWFSSKDEVPTVKRKREKLNDPDGERIC